MTKVQHLSTSKVFFFPFSLESKENEGRGVYLDFKKKQKKTLPSGGECPENTVLIRVPD